MSAELTPYERLSEARRTKFTPEVAKARAREQMRRHAAARRRVAAVLAQRYPEEYAELLAIEFAAVNRKRGPLPGDPE